MGTIWFGFLVGIGLMLSVGFVVLVVVVWRPLLRMVEFVSWPMLLIGGGLSAWLELGNAELKGWPEMTVYIGIAWLLWKVLRGVGEWMEG